MAGSISYFYATPRGVASTNAPNLVDRIKFQSDTSCHGRVRATIPQFDVQRTSGVAKTNAPTLSDMPILRAAAICRCSTGQLARLYGRLAESSPTAVQSNQYVGHAHRIVTPLTFPMTTNDVFIESFSWTGMLSAGHIMEIQDVRGGTIARGVSQQASDSNMMQVSVKQFVAGGYLVPALDSGVLVVTLGPLSRNARGAGRS